MLTWDDTLKLCIPFIFSISLIWIHYQIARYLESRAKKESLWRIFSTKNAELANDIDELDCLTDAYKSGYYANFTYSLGELPKNIAMRLSELNPRQTFIYERYVSAHSISKNNILSLQSIIHCLITTTEINNDRARNAIQSQVRALKENLIDMCEAQIFVMEHFSKTNNRLFDQQTITQAKNTIASLKARS